jgi:hypothetical protein
VSNDKVVLECPQCYWIFEVKGPIFCFQLLSMSKPQDSRIEGKVIEVAHICRNPKCKKLTFSG